MLSSIMFFLSALTTLYMLIIVLRLLMSWFYISMGYDRKTFITVLTDPYLNIFKKISFLRVGNMDFSPVAALIFLSVISTIFLKIAYGEEISLSFVIAIIISSIWSAFLFFIIFLIAVIVIRIISIFFHASSVKPLWYTIDNLLSPMTYRLTRLIFKNRLIPYYASLALLGALLTLLAVLGNMVIEDFLIGKLVKLIPV